MWGQRQSTWKGSVQRRSVLHPLLPLCRHRAQSMGWPVAFKYRLSSIKPVETLQVFPTQQHNTAKSTDQVRKIRSSLSTLFVHGYKPQVAAGCICQHVNMPSAGVHGSVACLKSYVYHNYDGTFTTTKVLVATQAQQLQLCSLPLEIPWGRHSLLKLLLAMFSLQMDQEKVLQRKFLETCFVHPALTTSKASTCFS